MGFEWAPGGLQAEVGVTLQLVWARIASADVSQGADRGEDTRNSTAGIPVLNRSEMSKSRSWCLPWRRKSTQSRLSGRESLDNCHAVSRGAVRAAPPSPILRKRKTPGKFRLTDR
jgi:hypothetical protein